MKDWKSNFFKIWTGQAASTLTSSTLQFAIMWYLTDIRGSALILSAAMFIGFMPQALFGPFIGVFIDRYNRKRIMIISDLFIAGISLVLVIAGVFGEIPIPLIFLILLLRSIGTAFHQPTLQAVTPQIVPADQLTKCSGYSQALESISSLASPAIAGLLYSNWNLEGIVLLDVIGAFIAVFTLYISKVPKHINSLNSNASNGELIIASIDKTPKKADTRNHTFYKIIIEAKEGFILLSSNKGVMALVLIGMLYTLALMPVSALFPLISKTYFGGTSYNASIVEISFSIGLLIGSIILGIWGGTKNKVYTIVGSYLLMSFSLIYTGLLSPSDFNTFVVMSFLMGISGPFYWGMYTPILQQSVEAEYTGRIMSLSKSIQLISAPIGLSASGVIADAFGVEKWFMVAGIITLIAAGLCIMIPSIRRSQKV